MAEARETTQWSEREFYEDNVSLVSSGKLFRLFTIKQDEQYFNSKYRCKICSNYLKNGRSSVCSDCFIETKCPVCSKIRIIKPKDHKYRKIMGFINSKTGVCCSQKCVNIMYPEICSNAGKMSVKKQKENGQLEKFLQKGHTKESRIKAANKFKENYKLGKFKTGVDIMNSPEIMKKKFSPESNKKRIQTKIENGTMEKWVHIINSKEIVDKRNKKFKEYLDINNNSKEAINYRNMIQNNLLSNINWTFDRRIKCNKSCLLFEECTKEEKEKSLKNTSGKCQKGQNFIYKETFRKMHIFNKQIECSKSCLLFEECTKEEKEKSLKNCFGYCENSPSIIKNKSIYEYDKNGNIIKIKEQDWDIYSGIERCSIDEFDEKVINVKTGLSQDAKDWSEVRKAFEQRLSTIGKHLVILKADTTGKIIQVSITHTLSCEDFLGKSDIKFRKYNSDRTPFGAVGKYLHEKGLDYDKTQIWVIPYETREEAEEKEKEMMEKYNLFY